MRTISKVLSLGLLSVSSFMMSQTYAAPSKAANEENIEVTQQQVSKEELAAIYVLSDICPSLIKTDSAFEKGFDHLLKDYLPNEKNPSSALKSIAKQKGYAAALKEARSDAKKAGDKENTAICNDIRNYQS